MEKQKKNILKYFKAKNHFVIRDESFEHKNSFMLSRGMIYVFGILAFLIFGFLIYLIISFTSLKKFIPGYPQNATEVYEKNKSNVLNFNKIEQDNKNKELWIKNLSAILSGNDTILFRDVVDSIKNDSTFDYKNIIFERSKEDSILRDNVKLENKLSQNSIVRKLLFDNMNFQSPNSGEIKNKLNGKLNEITYLSNRESAINSGMKGVVIYLEDKNIVIQHNNDFITVYKNCSDISVKIGETIPAGKEIAVVPDSIFQFQLWHNGNSISGDLFLGE